MQSVFDTVVDEDNAGYLSLKEMMAISSSSLIYLNDILPKTDFIRGNTTIVKIQDGYYLLNVRNVNYEIDENGFWYHANPDKSIDTKNEFVILEKGTFHIKSHKWFVTDVQKTRYRGLEDIRIVQIGDELHYCASYQKQTDLKIAISSHYYTLHLPNLPIRIIDSPFHHLVEKNWSMFVSNDQLKFVYGWYPLQIGVLTENNQLEIIYQKDYKQPFFRFIKNSSVGVWDEDHTSIWFLVHFNSANESFRTYYHMFIILDGATLHIRRMSKCFTFEKQKIEYCLGFVLEKDEIVFTYTTFDKNPRILRVDRSKMELQLSDFQEE